MDPSILFLVELLIFSGAVVAFCIWQIWDTRPSKDAAASPEDAGHPEGEKGP